MSATREVTMNLIDRLLNMWNSQNYDGASELYAEDYRGVDVTDHTRLYGPAAVARELERLCRAFPDLVFSKEHTIHENDRVALYWSARGTHQGTVLNIPATGRSVVVNGVTLLRVTDGKITQGVHLWDMAGLLRDLGLLPELSYRPPTDAVTFKDAFTIFA